MSFSIASKKTLTALRRAVITTSRVVSGVTNGLPAWHQCIITTPGDTKYAWLVLSWLHMHDTLPQYKLVPQQPCSDCALWRQSCQAWPALAQLSEQQTCQCCNPKGSTAGTACMGTHRRDRRPSSCQSGTGCGPAAAWAARSAPAPCRCAGRTPGSDGKIVSWKYVSPCRISDCATKGVRELYGQ